MAQLATAHASVHLAALTLLACGAAALPSDRDSHSGRGGANASGSAARRDRGPAAAVQPDWLDDFEYGLDARNWVRRRRRRVRTASAACGRVRRPRRRAGTDLDDARAQHLELTQSGGGNGEFQMYVNSFQTCAQTPDPQPWPRAPGHCAHIDLPGDHDCNCVIL